MSRLQNTQGRRRSAGLFAVALAAGLGGCAFESPQVGGFGKAKTVIAPPSSGLDDPSEATACGAENYMGLVGRDWDGTVKLPPRARLIHHGDYVTQDYVPERLNIDLDEKGRVKRVWCG